MREGWRRGDVGPERCQVVQMPDDGRIVVLFCVLPGAHTPGKSAQLISCCLDGIDAGESGHLGWLPPQLGDQRADRAVDRGEHWSLHGHFHTEVRAKPLPCCAFRWIVNAESGRS